MAPVNSSSRLKAGSRKAGKAPSGRRPRHFLHHSHVFASVVREVLERKFLEEITPHALTRSQFHLLKVIALNGGRQVGEVAIFLGVSPPAATKNIDKLKRLGLILRTPSKDDRRATLISPSAKGRRLVQAYEVLKADRLAPVLQEFNGEELDQFLDFLERFYVSVLRREDSGGGLCLRCAAYCQEDCSVGRIRGGCPYVGLRGVRADEGAVKKTW